MRTRVVLAVVAVLVAAAAVGAGIALTRNHGGRNAARTTTGTHARATVARRPGIRARLVERPLQPLSAPLQDAAAAAFRGGAVLLGGLTAADTSTKDIVVVRGGRSTVQNGPLPAALHDAAAVAIGRDTYLFGGGDVHQFDSIVRVAPFASSVSAVGRLPAAASDVGAAAVGDTAYVVGGYTGTRWLDTIVAWRPRSRARVVAHLPFALRYAAVTAAAGKVVIAGGSRESGSASDAVLVFDPKTSRVRTVGRLPAPTTHAAAAAIGNEAYIVGGRGAAPDTPVRRIVRVDPATGAIVSAGRLRTARSDLAAVTTGSSILLVGGRAAGATVARVSALVPQRPRQLASSDRPAQPTTLGPRSLEATNVYAADTPTNLAPAARAALPRVYVPNSESNTVDVIDPRTYKVVEHFAVGALPQHVTPAYDLKTLYVLNDVGNSLTPIDPLTAKPGKPIPVEDPYNMYFTPDGRYAIVVAERLHRLDFRNAHTFRLHRSLDVPDCVGVDHMDFTADGRYALASCEFSGRMIWVDVARERVLRTIHLPNGSGMPQDVKLSPDGKLFYVADMRSNGVWIIRAHDPKVLTLMYTGRGAHGLYPSRDAKYLYVTNRDEGSISVISFRTHRKVAKWWIPGGGSPDMGNVSPNGKVLWLTGRYNAVVYAISTRNGRLLAKIPVGLGPHGLCVWPEPGRYSLGHTGILR